MKSLLSLLLFILVLAPRTSAQEPSAKDLRTLLHADVKSYANDGRLVASWPLMKPEELDAFDVTAADTVKLLAAEGLCFSGSEENEAHCAFKELEFAQPCRISFEVRLAGADSMLCANLGDPAHPDEGFFVGVNMRVYHDSAERFDFIGRIKSAAAEGKPVTAPSSATPKTWVPVTVELKKGRLSLTSGKSERCAMTDVTLKRFSIALAVSEGNATIRNLAVDSQVDRDSVRKMFRSVKASEADKGAESRAADEDSAWSTVARELHSRPLAENAMAEIKTLPREARELVLASVKLVGDESVAAADKLDAAIRLAPKSGVALWLRGVVAHEQGEGGRAVEFLEKAVAANPDLADAWVALAGVRADRAQPEKALEALAKAEALDPKDPSVNVARARIHYEALRLEPTRREISLALTKKPDSAGLKALSAQLDKLSAHPDWKTSYKKENAFYIVETSISGKVAADLAQRLQVYRRFLDEKFPIGVKQTTPSRVWVFDSEKEYHVFGALLAADLDQSVGSYNALNKTLMLTSKVSAETTQHVVFHEAFHQYLDLATSTAPIWFDEGLAEYFGATTFDVSNRASEGGILGDRIPALRHGHLFPAGELMAMTPGDFMNARNVDVAYAESWALVHYFKRGGNVSHTKLFQEYCAAVIAGKSQNDALEKTFARDGGATLAAIDAAFGDYVKNRLLAPR